MANTGVLILADMWTGALVGAAIGAVAGAIVYIVRLAISGKGGDKDR